MTDDHVPQRPGSQQASSDNKGEAPTAVVEREESSSRGPSPTTADEEKDQDQDQDQGTSPEPESTGGNDHRSNDKGMGVETVASPGAWQAIYSPQYNAYYFYNAETQETTWANPLAPSSDPTSGSASASTSSELDAEQDPMAASIMDPRYAAMQQAAIAQGIDPALAYLDPSLDSSMPSTSAVPGGFAFTAKFNARTVRAHEAHESVLLRRKRMGAAAVGAGREY
ncbi:hypothetical protein AX15_005088 [Amanita polypyramis BW_CC]|nr:hypothetical protein AX15_005088 [Amanita polypyramis BW_CC]